MENRFIVRDIVRGTKEVLDPGKQVWYIWDRKKEQLGLAYYLTKEAAQSICDRKNSRNG